MTASHDAHGSPSSICTLISRSSIAIENREASINSLIATLDAWRLEKVLRRTHHNLYFPNYNEPLGEAIL